MKTQDFKALSSFGLLPRVEAAVLDAHRKWWEASGHRWTRPAGYEWLHYEDTNPIDRLADGVRKLQADDVAFDSGLVEAAEMVAAEQGYQPAV